jgi:hypothetical protein
MAVCNRKFGAFCKGIQTATLPPCPYHPDISRVLVQTLNLFPFLLGVFTSDPLHV